MDELKRVMDAFAPLDTPAYQRTLAERPGYREFGDAQVGGAEPGDVGDDVARDPRPARPARRPGGGALPDARARRRARTSRSVGVSEQMAATIPGAELVVIPDAGHSPQFENGPAWLDDAAAVPRPRRGRLARASDAARAATRAGQAVPAARWRNRSCSTATRVMRPAATSPDAVLHRHAEREAASLDRLEHGLGRDRLADRDRREVVELHAVADGRVTGRHVALDRGHRGPFGEEHHVRGGEHGHRAGALRERGVGVGDDVGHGSGETGVERHRRTIRNPHPTAPLGGGPCSRPQSSKPPCTAPSPAAATSPTSSSRTAP